MNSRGFMAQNNTRKEEHVWCVGQGVEVVVAIIKLSSWRKQGNPLKILPMSTNHG
jgi:hypothetical protein